MKDGNKIMTREEQFKSCPMCYSSYVTILTGSLCPIIQCSNGHQWRPDPPPPQELEAYWNDKYPEINDL